MTSNILIVEDDEMIRSLISERLKHAGYSAIEAGSGEEMFEKLDQSNIDMIILDLGLPDEDGIVLARKIRARSSIPLIILTARKDKENRIACLEVGEDDYLTKSVDTDEFLLRVRNLLNRTKANTKHTILNKPDNTLQFHGWQLDIDGFSLIDEQGVEADLTPAEIKLISVMANNAGRVLSRDQLLDAISTDIDGPSDRMIDAFISRIRKKIESDPRKPEILVTVTGVGYKFAAKID
jgi:two-component system, OmpR family, response regulator